LPANRDPRMVDAYTAHLNDWKVAGGGLYVVFESTGRRGRFGAFPLKEYQTQAMEETPKLNAVEEFIASNACWWKDRARDMFDKETGEEGNSDEVELSLTPIIVEKRGAIAVVRPSKAPSQLIAVNF
jgi:hypothetical protein